MNIDELRQLQNNKPDSDAGIDIRHYLNVLWSRKWLILITPIVFGLWAFMGTLSQKPFYTATLTLLFEQEEQPIVRIEDMYRGINRGYEFTQTQYGILKSRNIAEQVVRKAELHKHPYFQAAPPKPSKFNFFSKEAPARPIAIPEEQQIRNLIGFVSGGISIEGDDSQILELSFTSRDPQLSVLVVNTLAEVYIDDHLRAAVESAEKATEWLSQRVEDLYSNLKTSEAALQNFREQEQLIELQGGVITIGAREMEDLTAQHAQARAKRTSLESIYRQVKTGGDINDTDLLAIPALMQYGSIASVSQQLSDISRREAELAKRYGPKHPKMIALRSELNITKQRLSKELSNVVNSIEVEFKLAKETEATLLSQLQQSRTNLQDINRKEFKLQELQREVNANRQLYELFFQRVKETTDASGFVKPHARILDAAEGARASSISRFRNVLFAAVFGLALAMGIAIAIDFLDDKIKSPLDAQERLHMPFLGIIPLVRDSKGKKIKTLDFPNYWENTQSSFAESIRTIRTGIVLESLDSPAKVIVVTSTLPAEGKSTVALNLGSALGQMENVVIIGADLRRPTLASKLQLSDRTLGLSDYLSGEAQLADCIHKLDSGHFYVIPAGQIPSHPLEMLSSPRFKDLLDRLKGKFERIIIDSAPTHAVSDALVLSSLADTVVYVVKANETPAKLIRQGLKRLKDVSSSPAGIVLNDFDESKLSAYSGGGYYYDGYYSGKRA